MSSKTVSDKELRNWIDELTEAELRDVLKYLILLNGDAVQNAMTYVQRSNHQRTIDAIDETPAAAAPPLLRDHSGSYEKGVEGGAVDSLPPPGPSARRRRSAPDDNQHSRRNRVQATKPPKHALSEAQVQHPFSDQSTHSKQSSHSGTSSHSKKSKLLVLCTMLPTSKKQGEDQDKAMALCKLVGMIPYVVLAESKPEKRDQLLIVSKFRVYPQFFIQRYLDERGPSFEFIGDYDTVHELSKQKKFNSTLLYPKEIVTETTSESTRDDRSPLKPMSEFFDQTSQMRKALNKTPLSDYEESSHDSSTFHSRPEDNALSTHSARKSPLHVKQTIGRPPAPPTSTPLPHTSTGNEMPEDKSIDSLVAFDMDDPDPPPRNAAAPEPKSPEQQRQEQQRQHDLQDGVPSYLAGMNQPQDENDLESLGNDPNLIFDPPKPPPPARPLLAAAQKAAAAAAAEETSENRPPTRPQPMPEEPRADGSTPPATTLPSSRPSPEPPTNETSQPKAPDAQPPLPLPDRAKDTPADSPAQPTPAPTDWWNNAAKSMSPPGPKRETPKLPTTRPGMPDSDQSPPSTAQKPQEPSLTVTKPAVPKSSEEVETPQATQSSTKPSAEQPKSVQPTIPAGGGAPPWMANAAAGTSTPALPVTETPQPNVENQLVSPTPEAKQTGETASKNNSTNAPIPANSESTSRASDPQRSEPESTRRNKQPERPKLPDGGACYLVYDAVHWELNIYYSELPIVGAVGVWTSADIQYFKEAQGLGASEKIGNCASGVDDRMQYYNGWCQFVKAAKSMDAEVTVLDVGVPVDFWLYVNGTTLKAEGGFFSTELVGAVACVPRNAEFPYDLKGKKWSKAAKKIGAVALFHSLSSKDGEGGGTPPTLSDVQPGRSPRQSIEPITPLQGAPPTILEDEAFGEEVGDKSEAMPTSNEEPVQPEVSPQMRASQDMSGIAPKSNEDSKQPEMPEQASELALPPSNVESNATTEPPHEGSPEALVGDQEPLPLSATPQQEITTRTSANPTDAISVSQETTQEDTSQIGTVTKNEPTSVPDAKQEKPAEAEPVKEATKQQESAEEQSPPAPVLNSHDGYVSSMTAPNPDGGASYLVYDPDSSGRVVEHYSKTPITDAIGRWTPGGNKKIAGFKFKQNVGRNVIIGNCSAGNQGRKNYSSGWCQFVRAARMSNGEVILWDPVAKGLMVDVYIYNDDNRPTKQTVKLLPGVPVSVDKSLAVACIPKGTPFFQGMSVDIMKWLADSGSCGGASIQFK